MGEILYLNDVTNIVIKQYRFIISLVGMISSKLCRVYIYV